MSTPSPLDLPQCLGDALTAAGFTYDAVTELLGPVGAEALARNETTPGLRRATGGSPVETLARLFLLQAPVSEAAAQAALPGLVDAMVGAQFLARVDGGVVARLDVRPYATGDDDLWVASDLTPGLDGRPVRVEADHVLGISSASTSLARLTMRDHVGSSLDLGTGCGVQALHLAGHSGAVVATDVNRRALRLARFNAALNGVSARVDVREGSLFDPVRGERFDLVATNPPFVISPATDQRLVYRDSGLPGDRVVEEIVREAPGHLTEGGWCQVLANWVIARGVPWDERLLPWVADDCDAFVVQREVLDPAAYVELWLKDAGLHGAPDYAARYDTWLSWFDEQGVEGVGFGWINLHRRVSTGRTRDFLEWPYDVEQPIAPAIRDWGLAVDTVGGPDADARLVARPDVQQESVGRPGAEDPGTVVIRQQRGLRRARQVDTVEAALVGACDGELSVGQILDAVSQLLDLDAAQTRATYLPVVGELVVEGFLEVPGGGVR